MWFRDEGIHSFRGRDESDAPDASARLLFVVFSGSTRNESRRRTRETSPAFLGQLPRGQGHGPWLPPERRRFPTERSLRNIAGCFCVFQLVVTRHELLAFSPQRLQRQEIWKRHEVSPENYQHILTSSFLSLLLYILLRTTSFKFKTIRTLLKCAHQR